MMKEERFMSQPTICLSMIVKDEAHVIERCLRSVLPLIDKWIISDTGSSDNTQDVIRSVMAGKPGTLIERRWRNFADNRNDSLELAQAVADYVLFIDADETLVLSEPLDKSALSHDGYYLTCDYDGTSYARLALVSSQLQWTWKGVLHEFLESNRPSDCGSLDNPRIRIAHEGARSRDPDTYIKDAVVLEEALALEPDNARYVFYLAQTYKDAGKLAKAREVYQRRVAMGGFEEELWYAKYQLAVLAERLELSPAEVSRAYLEAYEARPTRCEPLVALARYHRLRSEFNLGVLYARQACRLPQPADFLFVEASCYVWQALDELSVSAYYAGPTDEGIAATRALLLKPDLPEDIRPRVTDNLRLYQEHRTV
jgi:glycosyltransferase involved in cell wall biosynthesis